MIDYKTHWLIGELELSKPIEIDNAVEAVIEYVDGVYYKSKNTRLAEWNPDKGEIFELVMTLFRIALEGENTYQAMIGMIVHKIDCALELDRAKCAAEVIGVCVNTELLTIEKRYAGYVIDTDFVIDKELPEIDKHQILFEKPKLKTTNQLLGGRLKYHSEFTCLDHLNRMSEIPLKINSDLLKILEEESDSELDTDEKKEQWEQFASDSLDKYLEASDREFYLEWAADLRGRCYSQGYHINPQGSSFKKAICELAHKEYLNEQ